LKVLEAIPDLVGERGAKWTANRAVHCGVVQFSGGLKIVGYFDKLAY